MFPALARHVKRVEPPLVTLTSGGLDEAIVRALAVWACVRVWKGAVTWEDQKPINLKIKRCILEL